MLEKKSAVAKLQRRKLSPECKAQVALAALRDDQTLAQLCAEFKVHSTQISGWKRQLVKHAVEGFAQRGGTKRVPAIDELHVRHPFMGARQLKRELLRAGTDVGRCHIRTHMWRLDIEAQCPQPGKSKPAPGHKIYPYLLRCISITRANQVWALDTTPAFAAAGSTSRWSAGLSISRRWWMWPFDVCSPTRRPPRLRRITPWRSSSRRSHSLASPRSSTPIRAVSSPLRSSRTRCADEARGSPWMVVARGEIMCLSSGCGEA